MYIIWNQITNYKEQMARTFLYPYT